MKKTLIISGKTRALLFIIAGVLVAGILFVSCGGGGYGGGGGGMYGGTSMGKMPGVFSLTLPTNGTINVPATSDLILTWGASSGATSYTLEVSTVSTFMTTLISAPSLTMTSYTVPANTLASGGTTYYWRVMAFNIYGMYTTPAWTFKTM